jgi:hypothetical protein
MRSTLKVSDDVEARKKTAEKGWIGEPQPKRRRQLGVIARKAFQYFHLPSAMN